MTAKIASLVGAIAAFAWPSVALVFLLLFKSEIRDVLKRLSHIKKGKVFGQEIEWETELSDLKISAEKAQKQAAESIPPPLQTAHIALPGEINTSQNNLVVIANVENQVLAETAKSPRTALLLISSEIEQRLRRLLAVTGWHQSIPATSLEVAIDRLVTQGSLPEHVRGTFKLFRDVRNKIVHGHQASDEDVFSAIDSALILFRALDAIPTETNVVYQTDVELYSDAACSHALEGVKGLILETTSPGQARKSFRILPTTKTHFKEGSPVAWEWNFQKTWGNTWYKDPKSGRVQKAWESAAEFTGRHLDDV